MILKLYNALIIEYNKTLIKINNKLLFKIEKVIINNIKNKNHIDQ